jgi:hypothetical protein
MPEKHKHQDEFNPNWETEIAEYDKACAKEDRDFKRHFMVITEAGHKSLSVDENEVLKLFLNGVSCKEIAKQAKVEPEEVEALLEIIRAKLSMEK